MGAREPENCSERRRSGRYASISSSHSDMGT
jgi:hypothetical protein